MYSYFKDTATVKRSVLSNWKSIFQSTWKTYKWFLKPISSEDNLYQDRFWQDFNFHTTDTADIKTSDILTIDNIDYTVKWVWISKGFRVKYTKCLVTKTK